MKLVALSATVATLTTDAANECAWADTFEHPAQSDTVRVLPQQQPAQLAATDREDETRGPICKAPVAQSADTENIDFTATRQSHLIDALDQAASVQEAQALLRKAIAALYNNPADRALHAAALRAVDKARWQLLNDEHLQQQAQPTAPASPVAEHTAALDQLEFAIHMPQLNRQQQMWRMRAAWLAGNRVAREKAQVMEQERAQLRAQGPQP